MKRPDPTQLTNEDCAEPGRLVPVIDRNRCEGKAECKPICADQCHGCGLCVKVCPETAIKLAKASP